ncbi:hypothetical protein BYT27DRAFT_7090019 [Phlegmacium glaucopus]|nr:hypothetical protein BYT27DRAFT_7090019 [Phlegmacium glaucopus]
MPSYRRLQQYALAISVVSIIYNGLEGGLSIGFGAESGSRSLIFFGVQSGIEVISAILVLWRFRKVAKPGEERSSALNEADLRVEKLGTFGIGILLIALALGTAGSAVALLVLHQEPTTSNASLIISASALVIMILIWLPKRYLAKALDSSTMRGEATCSLSCIQITCVLFVGSLLFRVWRGGWWVDGATSIVLSILFGWEGFKMVKWASSAQFTGGCCQSCRIVTPTSGSTELGEVYRDICNCCSEKESCRNSDECKCPPDSASHEINGGAQCCTPTVATGTKCCTREIIRAPHTATALNPEATTQQIVGTTACSTEPTSKKSCCAGCSPNS